MHLSKSPSINDVSSKEEGGGVKNVRLYLKVVKRRQEGREGLIKSEKWAEVVYGWSLRGNEFQSEKRRCQCSRPMAHQSKEGMKQGMAQP